MMRRDHALEILRQHVNEQIVVAVYQTLFDWMVIHPRDLNYVATGAMGQASSHALGLALANPERDVIVFDGDGSLLMNLGSLVTVANAAPANLHHFVFENGVYEVNGAHPTPAAGQVDFAAMATAAGYRDSRVFDDLETFETAVYFSFVTFTTLGYGDITLSESGRVLSGIQALNGILLVGWSTAVLFAVVQKLWQRDPSFKVSN